MTIQHIDPDSPEFEDAPRALRDYVKKVQKALKDVESDRDALRTQLHTRALGDVLADKGFKNPKRVERDLLADGIDPLDTAAVETWLSDNGDDYAKGEATSAPATDTPPDPQAAGHQAIQSVMDDATRADAQTRYERALAEITEDMDGEAVAAVFAKHGV